MIEHDSKIIEGLGSISVMTIAGNYLITSLREMIIWLICMFAVILCDLVAGVSHARKLRIPVRGSEAIRRTFSKSVVYFAVVAMAVLLNIATDRIYSLDKWAVLAVAFVESLSIGGHILAMRGYRLDPIKLIQLLAKKRYELVSDELEDLIQKSDDENEEDDKRIKKQQSR